MHTLPATIVTALVLLLTSLSSGHAEDINVSAPNRNVILNADGTWSYRSLDPKTGIVGYDSTGQAYRLLEQGDGSTVSRTWTAIDQTSGRIDVSVSRIILDQSDDAHGCFPVFAVRNITPFRVDMMLIGIEYMRDGARIGGDSFMLTEFDSRDETDIGGQGILGICEGVTAEVTVLECRSALFGGCATLVKASRFGAIALANAE